MLDLSKNKLVMIGAGGHCRSVIDSMRGIERWKMAEVVITDRDADIYTPIQGCKVVGTDDILPELFSNGFQDAVVSIGSIKKTDIRRKIYVTAESIGFSFPEIVDITSTIAADVVVGEGVFIGKNTVINSAAQINRFAIINSGSIIEHGCIVGEFSHVAVGAVVCGGCKIGSDVFVGANATVIQGVHIGKNSIVGAGSLVLADVPEDTMVTGVWGKGNT